MRAAARAVSPLGRRVAEFAKEVLRMPKTTKGGKAKKSELPPTLRRSSDEAQRTWAKAHDSAVETYGEGERAHRTAYSALKHKFEKKGDRWVRKDGKGPSDPRAKNPRAREGKGKSFGGVDYEGSSKRELYERAKKLGVQGRSSMSKEELAEAIARKQ
jgi:cation transport regulator ChaB